MIHSDPQPDRRHLRGFTLLEVLIATAIMGVLAASLYSTLHIAFRARAAAERRLEPIHQLTLSLDMLADELRTTLPLTGMLAMEFVGEHEVNRHGKRTDTILFYNTRTYVPWDNHNTGYREVELMLVPDFDAADDHAMMLVRHTRPTPLTPVRPEPEELIITRNIAAFSARYHDGSSWRDEWHSEDEGEILPYAVELTLELLPDERQLQQGEPGRRLTRIVPLHNASAEPLEGGGQIRRRP